jgi:TRAP-type C4-dicarboxylate transport system substrate-binding protein
MKVFLAALFAVVALGFTTATRAEPPVKLRLAHELPITHYGHTYIDRWAKLVKERSKGEIEVTVFPAGQLYKDADAVQALSTGGLDMQLAVASYLSVIIPQARIIDLPYLTPTPYELPELLDPTKPLGAYLNERAKEKGLNILSWWAAGDVMLLNSRAPVNTAADLKGLTLRVIGGAPAEAAIKTLGAEPIHLSPVELTTAVSQGTVQGFESTYSFWKLFPTMKYGTNAGTVAMLGYAVIASDRAWNKLSPAHRELLQKSLAEVTAAEIAGVKELDITDRAALSTQCRQITVLPAPELKRWRDAAEPVYARFENEIGADVMKLLAAQRKKP